MAISKKIQFLPVIVVFILGLLYYFSLPLMAFFNSFITKDSITYQVSDGYKGWVKVTFDSKDVNCNISKSAKLVVEVDSTGEGCTDALYIKTWHRVKYQYQSGENIKYINGFSISDNRVLTFFIGDEDELRNSWNDQPNS